MTVRVLVTDDHPVVRYGLAELISGEPGFEVVGEAASGPEAVRKVKELKPDIVVMDVRMPQGDGIDACRNIRSAHPKTKVLILTSFNDDESLLGSIVAGASGFLLKELGTDALLTALETISKGGSLLDPAVTGRVLHQMQSMLNPIATDVALSPQEERILHMIAEGMTNREIAESMKLSINTVRNYIANMFQKLGITTRSQAAAYAVRTKLSSRGH